MKVKFIRLRTEIVDTSPQVAERFRITRDFIKCIVSLPFTNHDTLIDVTVS